MSRQLAAVSTVRQEDNTPSRPWPLRTSSRSGIPMEAVVQGGILGWLQTVRAKPGARSRPRRRHAGCGTPSLNACTPTLSTGPCRIDEAPGRWNALPLSPPLSCSPTRRSRSTVTLGSGRASVASIDLTGSGRLSTETSICPWAQPPRSSGRLRATQPKRDACSSRELVQLNATYRQSKGLLFTLRWTGPGRATKSTR